ncbi:hypothetical protein CYMTET_26878 [Cymbomonas tetramitiformis]|uniref:Uncharacterized protein n=1 Tax=Cymbomonas tetramitiformis TaxID=36881 RepID=A0AAE0KXT4_9CHLO|nr:hypothetical protein CYMTET_26878 [Cymbomonas tetramitiformis]
MWLCMLFITMLMYYSRAVSCCGQLQDYVGCPGSSGTEVIDCLGLVRCGALADTAYLLPEELNLRHYECTAFPQKNMLSRLYASLYIFLVVFPVSLTFTALFTISGFRTAPQYLRLPISGTKAELLYGRGTALLLETAFTFFYSVFVNFSKFNKIMASLLMGAIYLWLKPVSLIKGGLDKLKQYTVRETFRKRSAFFGLELQEEPKYMTPLRNDWVAIFGYFLVIMFWILLTLLLIQHSTRIRDMMGESAEETFLEGWGLALLMELTGETAGHLLLLKLLPTIIVRIIHGRLVPNLSLELQYEKYVAQYAHVKSRVQGIDEEYEEDEGSSSEDEEDDDDMVAMSYDF